MVGFVLSVRMPEIGVSHHSNAMKEIGEFVLGVRMSEMQGNQCSNAILKNGQNWWFYDANASVQRSNAQRIENLKLA